MPTLTLPDAARFRAARLKAEGCSWEHVARTLTLNAAQIDDLRDDPEWDRLYRLSRRHIEREMHDETVRTVRGLMRSDDPKVALKATELALKLRMTRIRHRKKKPAAVEPPAVVTPEPPDLTDEQVHHLMKHTRNMLDLKAQLRKRDEEERGDDGGGDGGDGPIDPRDGPPGGGGCAGGVEDLTPGPSPFALTSRSGGRGEEESATLSRLPARAG